MAEILLIRCKKLSNQSINKKVIQGENGQFWNLLLKVLPLFRIGSVWICLRLFHCMMYILHCVFQIWKNSSTVFFFNVYYSNLVGMQMSDIYFIANSQKSKRTIHLLIIMGLNLSTDNITDKKQWFFIW